MTDYALPTLGEFVKTLFDITGVMPRKHEAQQEPTGFSEKQKKTYQTRLQRLAKERGELQPNVDQLFALLAQCLDYAIRCPVRASQLTALINDLYGLYASLVKTQGTFMSKRDSVRFLLVTYLADEGTRCLMREWLKSLGFVIQPIRPPDPFWFLPTSEAGRQVSPLSKVLRWAYESCGQTLVGFHRQPSPEGQDPDTHEWRNEKSARNWQRGESIPSLGNLMQNLETSFEVQEAIGNPIDTPLQDAIVTHAVLARMATMAASLISQAFGQAFLEKLCAQIRVYATWMNEELDDFNREYEEQRGQIGPGQEQNAQVLLGLKMAPQFWAFFEAKRQSASEILRHHTSLTGEPDPSLVKRIESTYGSYVARVPLDAVSRWCQPPPVGIVALIERGLSLRKDPEISPAAIDAYEADMAQAEVAARLAWLLHWLRGVACYRAEDFASAATHYQQAFDAAKYTAGEYQYLLVNQYIEVMAKTRQWRPFKKGVLWACYLGVSVRWLREDEPTTDNLKWVYGLMGLPQVNYPLL
ncbi:hypothetical protein MHM84_20335 [Halomonas sp. McH1-25]|uniref:hypothetical protein n=1 Tax=unclassified Halomonas TaxID=2609666 RepID=UPI001EF5259B|nr:MULTISPECIES: hypothetical protein [unclassified Halomonas]MCG7602093.1 hypothetical protein [Halomonas sp. McH1-25]MCP1343009.1 hypothetical protein [Halomonas sp. FL8]MCP1362535.1 hypothetical protein [Halomonas sp. BBD45]MCP1364314.1 hypothetical protein [Halomonas sp. BBD48]